MSNERVDVGTIMARDALDAAIRRQWDDVSYAQQCSEESEKARSAVAELIEAAQKVLDKTGVYGTMDVPSVGLDPLRVALSRIGARR